MLSGDGSERIFAEGGRDMLHQLRHCLGACRFQRGADTDTDQHFPRRDALVRIN